MKISVFLGFHRLFVLSLCWQSCFSQEIGSFSYQKNTLQANCVLTMCPAHSHGRCLVRLLARPPSAPVAFEAPVIVRCDDHSDSREAQAVITKLDSCAKTASLHSRIDKRRLRLPRVSQALGEARFHLHLLGQNFIGSSVRVAIFSLLKLGHSTLEQVNATEVVALKHVVATLQSVFCVAHAVLRQPDHRAHQVAHRQLLPCNLR